MTWRTFLTIALIATITGSSQAQNYRNQDAAVGGLAGAVIGGIIGHQNDETPEGALIGGAVGAIAGGLLGNAKDQDVARHRYYRHQAWQQQRQAIGRAVSINDVVSMSQSGLSDSVIINHVRTNGVIDHVDTHQIISMHQRGVSENVISAMQSAPKAGTATPRKETIIVNRPIVRQPSQVIVQEYVVPPRVRYTTRPAYPTYPSRHRYHRYW